MKICFVCCEYPPSPHGGIGTATQSLARELVRLGHKVRVVGIRDRGDSTPAHDVDCGVQVLRLPHPSVRRLGWIWRRYSLYREVAAAARRGDVDLVEAPDFEGWTAGWMRLPVPVVVRLQGSATYFSHETGLSIDRWTFKMEQMTLQQASFHCSVSRYTAEVTRRLFQLRHFEPKILYNPVKIPARLQSRVPAGSDVVFTGTLTAKKGIVHLVRAWPEVTRAFPAAQLHIYGRDGRSPAGGSMREYLLTQLPDSARSSVVFHGGVSHDVVLEALSSARVGVFPSFSEAFGLAPMESMAQGCPTIYSRCSSGPELISDGEDGLLVDPANEKEIAQAIMRVLGDMDLSRRLGAAKHRRVQDFSVETVTENNVRFYQDCLANW
jgi:glycosyltransferase involved in cell wall biosynthesis